jgi:hypothetical protein
MSKPTTLLAFLVLASATYSASAQQPPSAPAGVAIDRVVRPEQRVAPPATVVLTPPIQPVPTPNPALPPPGTSDTRRAAVAADGSIVVTMSNGVQRISRPGTCGYTLVFPDGRNSRVSCAQVQPATPALPDDTTGQWLDAHSESLLDVARRLLGNDQASIDNYLRNNERPDQSIYDRIRLRTSLLADLTTVE